MNLPETLKWTALFLFVCGSVDIFIWLRWNIFVFTPFFDLLMIVASPFVYLMSVAAKREINRND